jgi:hypothetical protein
MTELISFSKIDDVPKPGKIKKIDGLHQILDKGDALIKENFVD